MSGDFENFVQNNNVSYSSYKDAVTHYLKTLDKKYAEKSDDERQVYEAYKGFVEKTVNSDFAKAATPELIMPLLQKVNELGINAVKGSADKGLEELTDIYNTMNSRISAMKALKLPDNSEKEQVRAEFLAQAEAVFAKLEETINNIEQI